MGINIRQEIPKKKNVSKPAGWNWSDLLKKEIQFGNGSFNDTKKAAFYEELSVLLESGIHLKNSLELISQSETKPKEKELIERLVTDLINGGGLSITMYKEKMFSAYEYYAIKIGEETGRLTEIIKQLGVFYRRKVEQRSDIIGALIYPIIVLLTAFVVIGFMLKYVVPLFADIFKQNKVELPWITQQIVLASSFFSNYFWYLLMFFCLFLFLIFKIKEKEKFQRIWQQFILRIPVVNNYIKSIKLAQFTQAVSLMSSAKIEITKCLNMAANMVTFFPLSDALHTIEKKILVGEKMSNAFSYYPQLFNKKMIALLRVAEETNNTAYVFEKLHGQFDFEVKKQSQRLTNVLNPILTIIVGLLVGIILIAMYLPMFKLSSIIG